MAIDYPYIRQLIEKLEGKGIAKGYIPKDSAGKILGVSGVTIGTGFDLGQQSETRLHNMGILPSIIIKLKPYLTLQKDKANDFLRLNPLVLTPEEVAQMDEAVIRYYTNDTARRYNAGRPTNRFEDIPKQAQAVIASLFYQKGGPSTFPNTWMALLRGDWKDASTRLCTASMWSGYHSRRKIEGEILRLIGDNQ